jgi:hypothetical protein
VLVVLQPQVGKCKLPVGVFLEEPEEIPVITIREILYKRKKPEEESTRRDQGPCDSRVENGSRVVFRVDHFLSFENDAFDKATSTSKGLPY